MGRTDARPVQSGTDLTVLYEMAPPGKLVFGRQRTAQRISCVCILTRTCTSSDPYSHEGPMRLTDSIGRRYRTVHCGLADSQQGYTALKITLSRTDKIECTYLEVSQHQ